MDKSYRELTLNEKIKTFNNYQELCKNDSDLIPYEDFKEYDEDNYFNNFDFDSDTLEFLG